MRLTDEQDAEALAAIARLRAADREAAEALGRLMGTANANCCGCVWADSMADELEGPV